MEDKAITTMVLKKVQYMPKLLLPGVLYVAEEFGAAAHLCACGCGTKVRTPLWPTRWRLEETAKGPSLYPSVGNWQLPCQSHYWIRDGKILWEGQWTFDQIEVGRRSEEKELEAYYSELKQPSTLRKIWNWFVQHLMSHKR